MEPDGTGGTRIQTQVLRVAAARYDVPTEKELPAISRSDISTFLASGVPTQQASVPQEASIPLSLREQMVLLGIYTRSATPTETSARRYAKSAVYEQLVFDQDAASDQFEVVDIRLSESAVRGALKTYNEIFTTVAPDGSKASRLAEVEQILGDAYRQYLDTNASVDPAGFRNHLENGTSEPKNIAALGLIRKLGDLFQQIGYLGLTEKEAEISKSTLLKPIRIPGLSSRALRQNVDEVLKTAPATKTAGTPVRAEKASGQ
jgi:hypothetical protein